jgi:hypothetical protein
MAEEREAKVRLDVERTGDPEAFKEVAEDVGDLQEAVDSVNTDGAAEQLASLGDRAGSAAAQSQELTGALEAQKARIHEAGEAATQYGDKWVAASGKINLAMQLLGVVTEITGQIEQGLNSLSEKLGGTGEEFKAAGIAGVDFLVLPVGAIEKLTTAFTDLDLVLGVHTGKLEEQKRKHEEVRGEFLKTIEAMRQRADAQDDLNERTRTFLEGLDLSKEKLREEARELTDLIENAFKIDPDLDPELLAQKVGPMVAALVEKLRAAGGEIEPALQGWIDKLGLVVPAAADMATGVESGVARVTAAVAEIDPALQAVIDKFQLLRDEVTADTEAMVERLRLTKEEIEGLEQARLDSARRTAEELKNAADQLADAEAQRAEEIKRFDEERIEREKQGQELLAEAHELAAQRIAEAQELINKALGTPPETSGLQAVQAELAKTKEAADLAAAALAAVLNGTEGFPFAAGKPRYEPEGGFNTSDPLRPRPS